MRRRAPVVRPPGSREFVDETLAELRASRWSARGWARFLARNIVRSYEQAGRHPQAAAELTAEHMLLFAVRPGPWVAASWAMSITHLGLLAPDHDGLGWPNRVSLLRANLPVLARSCAPSIGVTALASDWADGRLARATGETAFGAYADALADVAFWTWYVLRHEESRVLRFAAVGLWLGPAAAITASYFGRGRSIDVPRPVAVRNLSVGLQVLVTLRAWCDGGHSRRPATFSAFDSARLIPSAASPSDMEDP